jgi:hypothetical protein
MMGIENLAMVCKVLVMVCKVLVTGHAQPVTSELYLVIARASRRHESQTIRAFLERMFANPRHAVSISGENGRVVVYFGP